MHMTQHQDWLTDITPSSVPSIRIANNKVLKVDVMPYEIWTEKKPRKSHEDFWTSCNGACS